MTLLLLAACAGAPSDKPADDTAAEADADTDTDADADTDADTDTDSDTDADVVAGATEGSLAVSFSLDASGGGRDRLDDVVIADGAGSLVLAGVDHAAVAYQDHDWDAAGYHLYDLISVAEDGSDLAVTYLYCQGDGMPYAYTESFAHPMDWEVTEGSCDGRAEAGAVDVSLPPLRALPPAFDPGVRIDGTGVSWDGADGSVTLDGETRALHPFNVVDCTDCPGGPWLEVHSLLDGDTDACFAILYLFPEDPTWVQVSYGLCLPTLERIEAVLDADWSGELVASPPPPGLHRPRPPAAWGVPPR